MVSYKTATLIQSILIILVGISTVDFGTAQNVLESGDKLKFNETVFSDDPSEFWNHYVFWAYAFFVVAILQLIKKDP
ncbi:MAG: hypothetical protein ACW99A_09645 [Candidatus Kariarchaeaceae archaeon]|jgi:hypothetical protein